MYIGDDPKDQSLCVVEHKAIKSLCQGLVQQCCYTSRPSWELESFMKAPQNLLVHAFTCAGMLPRQFINFCTFAELGEVKQRYISLVYTERQYQRIVADVAEELMKAAVEQVKAYPHYATCDLNTTEVAHDYQTARKRYVEELGMVNSYDTWHSTKNVAKEMRKISAGTVGTETIHGSLNSLTRSPCQQPGYHPKRKILTMPAAIQAYENAVKKTLVYRCVGSFCHCRDTYWVESFNHQLLTYLPKRIHFQEKTFDMRMNLAVMDWFSMWLPVMVAYHNNKSQFRSLQDDDDDGADLMLLDDAALVDGGE
eukprot:Em0017g462a